MCSGSSTQAKYTGVLNKMVFESSYSYMNGETDYAYQPGTPPTAIRVVDSTLDSAANAAQRAEQQPNSRVQFDNSLSYSESGWGGDHLFNACKAAPDHPSAPQRHAGDQFFIERQTSQPAGIAR